MSSNSKFPPVREVPKARFVYVVSFGKGRVASESEQVLDQFTMRELCDEDVLLYVATLLWVMNRRYTKVGEPRDVYVSKIIRQDIDANGSIIETPIPYDTSHPRYEGITNVRCVIRHFYQFPMQRTGRKLPSLMHTFNDWRIRPSLSAPFSY